MTVNELCGQYINSRNNWADRALDDFIDDLTEQGRTQAPRGLKRKGMYDKILWLVNECRPAYTLEDLEDFFIECQQP